jgi:hypothetical protein
MKRIRPLRQLALTGLSSIVLITIAPFGFAQTASLPGTAAGGSATANGAASASGQPSPGSYMHNPPAQGSAARSSASGSAATTSPHSTDSGNTPPNTASTSNPSALGNKNSISGAVPATNQ